MATNTVEILVKSREDAAPDMDALRARLEELGREVATARADVDDADAAAKLDRLAAKLDELGHRTANPKIRMSGALRAEAEIHAVEASLDRLNRKADETAAKGGVQGLLGKLFFGLGSEAGGGGGPGGGILSSIFRPAGLGIEFGKLSKAFQPQAFKVFDDVLKIANNLLPVITPLATAFAGAIDGLLKKAASFTESKGFKDFLKQFEGLVGPSTTAIGNGIGQLVTNFGKLLTIFSKKDVVNAINIAFSVLNGILSTMIYVFRRLKSYWDGITHTFDTVRHAAAELAGEIRQKFDHIRHDIAQWAGDVARDGGKVITWFKNLPGNILKGLGDLKTLLVQAGKDLVTGVINGIESMFGAIVSAAGSMVSHLGHSVLHLLGIGSPSKVAHWWGQMVAQGIAGGIDAQPHPVASGVARMALRVPAGLAAAAGGYGGDAGAGGGPQGIRLEGPSGAGLDWLLLGLLRDPVRVKG